MTRIFYSLFAILFLLISCQSSSPTQANAEAQDAKEDAAPSASAETASPTTSESLAPAAMPGDYVMKPDTIEIRGKFQAGCTKPSIIKVAQHTELGDAGFKQVAVNANGEFTYRIYLSEPRRIAMRTESRTNFDFIATTKEKVFTIDITCANGAEKLELKNSPENVAYRLFANANKKYKDDLDAAGKLDLSVAENFAQLKNKINEYQKTLTEIAAAHPATFTATVFCAAEKLPDGSLASIDALRKNFLQREALANPYIYNDFLGQRILLNYIAICDRKADQTNAVNSAMTIAAKSQDAAKRLQQICYNVFYNRHEEQFVTAYIKWAESNPTLMFNSTVKMSLQRLKHVMPGSQLTDIQLKNPSGAIKKLSETVASSTKLTLLIFYSPTCEHCQAEIPQIKPLWEQYKAKGLKIYAVGFDATNAEWNAFISGKASPEWTHVFEYPDGTQYSYQYVVNYTPTYIFINPQGKIVSRFPTFDDVKTRLPELMK